MEETTKPTKKGHRHYTTDEFCDALTKAKGIMSVAAKILGCNRSTIWEAVQRLPEAAKAQEQADETITDFAEGKLVQKIRKGETKAIIFRLETKGKKRGYTKSHEVSGPDGGPIPAEFTLNFTK